MAEGDHVFENKPVFRYRDLDRQRLWLKKSADSASLGYLPENGADLWCTFRRVLVFQHREKLFSRRVVEMLLELAQLGMSEHRRDRGGSFDT